MNAFKRAILYITRKKVKSIILLFILFCVAISSLSGVTIKKAATIARNESKEQLANSFEITGKTENESINLETINKVLEVKKISGYDAIINKTKMSFRNINQVEPTKETVTMLEDEYMNLMNVEGHDNTKSYSEFVNKNIQLIEGRHIEKGDTNKVLIHKALAELNNLNIGDKIKANRSELDPNISAKSKDEYELEIVGIFNTNNTERVGVKANLIENLIISDNNTLKELYGYNNENIKYKSTSFVSDENVENVIPDVKELAINWDDYDLITGEKKSQALSQTFNNLDKLINMMLIGGIVIGTAIIALVLAFWIQGRIKETGILLSIGISKVEIIGQYIIELLIISVIAFGMAYIPGKAAANEVGHVLVEQANNETAENAPEDYSNSNEINSRVDNIDVKIEFKELIYVYIIEAGIIISAVVISSLPIVTLKPKEILSKMS